MIKTHTVYSYIYDFLSLLFEKTRLIDNIDAIILFGSVAQGTFDSESDIDMFIQIKDLSYKKAVEKEVSKILTIFEINCEKTWALKQIDFAIKPLIGRLDEDRWKQLAEEISSTSCILYGKYNFKPDGLTNYALLSFSLSTLKQKDKMKVIRTLYGYTIKNNKKYVIEGIVKKINGIKLNSNTLLVPANNTKYIREILNEFKLKIKYKEVWMK